MKGNVMTEIRGVKLEDAKAIAEILRELGWFEYMKTESLQETQARVERHMKMCLADDSHTVLVAESRTENVVGYISVHWLPYMMLLGSEGYISELFVFESERGKGIGRRLLEAALESAKKHGCARLHLITGNYRDSYSIYKKLGWKERPEIADFILPVS
jgi:GNAT superfamily N-acetyltransferase